MVTGACGMVGSHLVDWYYERGMHITATYFTQPTIRLEEVRHKAQYIPCDVRRAPEVEAIIAACMPDVIYHLAAQSYPTVSWQKPVETMETNVHGTIHLFEAIKKIRKQNPLYNPMVLIACSSAEYGASLVPQNLPATEAVPLLPLHPYGVSKVAQDLLGYQYYVNDKIRCIRVRIFNTTGPRKTNDVVSDFTKRAVLWEMGKIDKISVGNLDTRRAITDVRDLRQALLLLAEKGTAGDVYNVCGSHIYQIGEIVDLISSIIGKQLPIETDAALLRSSDEPVIAGDSSKLIHQTGWQQTYTLQQTVADMIAYWRSVL